MSAQKFLSRIVSTDLTVEQSTRTNDVTVLHNQDYTHGICSDPVAMFAIVFSAFIHDVRLPDIVRKVNAHQSRHPLTSCFSCQIS